MLAPNRQIGRHKAPVRIGALGELGSRQLEVRFARKRRHLDGLGFLVERRAVDAHQPDPKLGGDGCGAVRDDVDGHRAILFVWRHEQIVVEPPRVILEGLPPAVVIHAGPGGHRPAVVQLPEDRAHGPRALAPQVLGPYLDSFGLQDLADVEERGKVARFRIVPQQVIVDDGVARVVLLVGQHHGGGDAGSVFRDGERFHGPHLGERLEAVLGHEAGEVFLVLAEGHPAVPHAPVVHVAGLVLGRYLFVIGAGRTGPVRSLGRQPFDRARQNAAKDGEVVLPHAPAHLGGLLVAFLPGKGALGFVVAAPDHDAGMIAQASKLVLRFGGDVLLERIGARLPVVAEHEILPDHDAEPVAHVVELIGFVVAAAPVPDHVHVGVHGGLEHLSILFGGNAGGETVERDDIRAFPEDRDAVDRKLEGAAPLVGIAAQDDGA